MYTNLSFSSPGYIETASGAPRLSRDPQQPQQTLPPHREIRQELVEKRQTQHIIIETTSNQFVNILIFIKYSIYNNIIVFIIIRTYIL